MATLSQAKGTFLSYKGQMGAQGRAHRLGRQVGLAVLGTPSAANHFSADILGSVWFMYQQPLWIHLH